MMHSFAPKREIFGEVWAPVSKVKPNGLISSDRCMLAKKGRIAWRLIAVRALETHAFAELFDPSNCNLWTMVCLNLR
jgi:hypothetical protein